MARERILVVDDEAEIRELISLYLVKEEFEVITAECSEQAFEMARMHEPAMIILDILLPGIDGFEVCRELRKETNVPILFLSCKGEDVDKILGFGVGGDDYITKPFSPGELVARVKAHVRRNRLLMAANRQAQSLKYSALEIDLVSHIVKVNGSPIALSVKEFQLLALLAQNPNQVFDINKLFELIWESQSLSDTRTVMVHISNLRKKIEKDPANPQYILTIRGVGYKFNSSLPKKL